MDARGLRNARRWSSVVTFTARHRTTTARQGHVSAAQQLAFAKRFGDVQGTHGEWSNEPGPVTGATHPVPVKMVDNIPQVLSLGSTADRPGAASGWHSDVTWAPKPPMGTILIGREVPPIGGNTLFSDA